MAEHYEKSSPATLAAQPVEAPPPAPVNTWPLLQAHLESRMQSLRTWRISWWQHWAKLAEFILPRRYHWLVAANSMQRGNQINQKIVDPTGTQAMRICASGMMSGMTPPSRPWFKLGPLDPAVALDHEGQLWLDEVEARVFEVMARSNFYDSIAQLDEDLVVFGTAPMIIYEDATDVIRCYNPCAGEYFLAPDSTFRNTTLYREFTLTIAQIVDMFGVANCPPEIQQLWATAGASLSAERVVAHAIEPNFEIKGVEVLRTRFPFREAYWLRGVSSPAPLSLRGFWSQPFIAPRWAITSNDPYGRSPAMDTLPDVMQLQVMTMRKAEAIEKQVRPPLLGSIELRNEPSSILPGHVTYVSNLGPSTGLRPIYEVKPELAYMTQDIAAIQARIRSGFFNDLFLMLAATDPSKRMTATEVAERQSEKLQVLGPVIERMQNEGLSLAIQRIVQIMARKNLLPALPRSLQGVELRINYISMLTQALKAAKAAGLERVVAQAGAMAAAIPDVLDNIDGDATLREYGEMLLVPRSIIRAPDKVAELRKARAKAQAEAAAQQQALTLGSAAVEGAEVLSKTDVGGGANALQLMLGA